MRVLVIRCGALGDLVYSTSVIDAIKLEFGEKAIIDFVCTPSTASLFEKDYRVNKVFLLKHKKLPIWLSSQKKAIIKASKETQYDILINLEFGKQFKSLVEKIYAKKKVGALIQNINIPKNITHSVEIIKYLYKDIVKQEVLDKSYPRLIGSNLNEVKQKFNLPQKYLIISPSNSHQKRKKINYRAWENDKWIELIKILSKEIKVVIIGGKNEKDFFEKLKPYPNNVIDLVGKTSLADLISVIDGAVGLVSTDTGTAHISSAVNTPVFTLIGPTPANQTGPYKTPFNKVYIITKNLPCSPCYKTEVMRKCNDNICMKQISVKEVYDTIKKANLW